MLEKPELCWKGKHPYTFTNSHSIILSEQYGKEVNRWLNKIYWGDNLHIMECLLDKFKSKIDLIYIDPPFNSNANYKKKIKVNDTLLEEKQYGDIWNNDEYLQFMYERLLLMKELLSDTGSIFLHCDWHISAYLKLLLDEIFGIDNFINEIIWGYKDIGGGRNNNFYKRKHDTIYWYSKTSNYKVNEIARDSLSESTLSRFSNLFDDKGIITYQKLKDLRPQEFLSRQKQGRVPQDLNTIFLSKDYGRQLEDYWIDLNPLRIRANKDNPNEILEYPTQKPESLLERIIKTVTKEGDLIFDCFMGSGTTQSVAMKLGRRFIGTDINLGSINTVIKRLIFIQNELIEETSLFDDNIKYTGFEVYKLDDIKETKTSQAEIIKEDNKIIVKSFYPVNLMTKLSLEKENIKEWKPYVDSIMIDFNYDGIFNPSVIDIANKNEQVKGVYNIPKKYTNICIKITDLLSECVKIEM